VVVDMSDSFEGLKAASSAAWAALHRGDVSPVCDRRGELARRVSRRVLDTVAYKPAPATARDGDVEMA